MFSSDGREEHFNMVLFYVLDMAHKEEVLGRASAMALYGPIAKRVREIGEATKSRANLSLQQN